MPAETAVLVPRDVGDALDDPDRLEERLDAVMAPGAEDVPVTGDLGEPEEPAVADQRLRRRGTLVEALHADELLLAAGGPRPPGVAVVRPVVRRGAVHVGRHGVHLLLGEEALDVQES